MNGVRQVTVAPDDAATVAALGRLRVAARGVPAAATRWMGRTAAVSPP